MIKQIIKLWRTGSRYSIDPLTIAGITAGISGLGNALFGSDNREYTMEDLVKYGYKPYDADRERADLQRILSARRKSRRQGIKGSNFQSGKNNPTDVYANEEDLSQAEVMGQSDIQRRQREENNRIANILFGLNAGQPEDQGFGLNFIEGALEGLPIGLEAGRLGRLGEQIEDNVIPTKTKLPKKNIDPIDTEAMPRPTDFIESRKDLSFLYGMTNQEFERFLNQKLGLG